MALPAAARRRAEEAVRISKEIGNRPAEPPAGDPPAPQPGAEADELRAQLKATEEALAKSQQAFRTLQNKYNEEVPRFAAQVKELSEAVKAANEARTKAYEAGELTSLTEKDREIVGEDVVGIISKAAREIATHEVESRLKPILDRVNRFEQMTTEGYQATLDRFVPAWDKQNDDPKFLAWLQDIDPATQKLRDELLQRAHDAKQGYLVADIFLAFREGREIGARDKPEPKKEQSPSPRKGAEGGPPPTDAQAGKRMWSRAEIQNFYRDKREGKYKGRAEEARNIENDIVAAYGEGRISG